MIVTYKSSNSKVATINSKGKLTAKKKGTTTVTIKSCDKYISNGLKRTFKVKIIVK